MDIVKEYIQEHIDEIPFKSLQPDEMEANAAEKQQIMQQILERDRGLFLSRWGRHLPLGILQEFEPFRKEYEVDIYLTQLLPTPKQEYTQRSIIHNRRYEYLKRYLRGSTYFSDESMQQHDPVLYEEFIGQHLTQDERSNPYDPEDNLVQRLLGNMDRRNAQERVQRQKMIDEEQFEEEDEDSEDNEEESGDGDGDLQMKESTHNGTKAIKEDEEDIEKMMTFREQQRSELVRLLEERFLSGKDTQFDYTTVDQNEAYDNIAQQEQDIQDRYFDEESDMINAESPSRPSVYTGVQDY
ncbi:coiled-coil domain-containing protein-domain-containing protein [Phascolomyces articulosus]|uniref:Coiled-coil domain-containing protein-domain-containing protein n=1 Tax=Phascolomyces articulosus TaxID=60185 RepID=A0AAD5KKX8_9FUNG|nr:coiled-coil domain-containing protein-domain-containing protein [Phascolomyces articulosus]